MQKEEVLSDQKLSCFNPGILSCAADYPKVLVLWGKGSLIQFSNTQLRVGKKLYVGIQSGGKLYIIHFYPVTDERYQSHLNEGGLTLWAN